MDKSLNLVDVLIFDDVNLLDVAGPVQAFHAANRWNATPYSLRYVSLEGAPVTASCGLKLGADAKASLDSTASDLIIPGGRGIDSLLLNHVAKPLLAEWLNTRTSGRLISICSGALLLANAGVLNGKAATTHWSRERQALTLFPEVSWQLNALYLKNGNIFTSAGVTTGIDLALSIIRSDCGPTVALNVARELVVYLQRAGGQSQYSDLLENQFTASGTLQTLIEAIVESPNKIWSLETMAETVSLTPRTLSRRFNAELGSSPVRYVEKLRVKSASEAIAAGMAVPKATSRFGFADFQQMQRAFKRNLGTTVGAFEKRFCQTALDQ